MVQKLFGTDGIRGHVMVYPITTDYMLHLGSVCGNMINEGVIGNGIPLVIIGYDTRASCCMLSVSLIAGLLSHGISVELIGCLPTSAVADFVHKKNAVCGIMISSSHNAADTNGIKFFNNDGYKFSAEQENMVEKRLFSDVKHAQIKNNLNNCVKYTTDADSYYIKLLRQRINPMSLEGMKVVLDCANGVAGSVAETLFSDMLRANVCIINDRPDGFNINSGCGVSHATEGICRKVVEINADVGVAFDGDGDRVIMCDNRGRLIDGDQLIAYLAVDYKKRGILKNDTVACTVLSNSELERFLNTHNIRVIKTPVGERSVIEAMSAHNLNLGGENSGHVIMRDYSTSDGIATAVQVLSIMKRLRSTKLSLFIPCPQIFRNVPYTDKWNSEAATKCIKEMEDYIGQNGRVLVRKSGTENVIRIMVECQNKERAQYATDVIANSLSG